MSSLEITGLVAIILMSAFAIVGIIVAVPLFKLINRIRFLAEGLNESLLPVVENLNNTVTRINSEISSIGEITQSAGSIVRQVEIVTRLARVVVTTPIIKLISAGIGLAGSIKKASVKSKKIN